MSVGRQPTPRGLLVRPPVTCVDPVSAEPTSGRVNCHARAHVELRSSFIVANGLCVDPEASSEKRSREAAAPLGRCRRLRRLRPAPPRPAGPGGERVLRPARSPHCLPGALQPLRPQRRPTNVPGPRQRGGLGVQTAAALPGRAASRCSTRVSLTTWGAAIFQALARPPTGAR